MRYGIIVEDSNASSRDLQHDILASAGCQEIIVEKNEISGPRRRVSRLLYRLRRGDELCVYDLDVFGRTTIQLVTLLRDLFELGVSVIVSRRAGEEIRLSADSSALAFAACVAEHEAGRPASARNGAGGDHRREENEGLRLTKYQIEYARKLYAEGASLRSIGLLFRATPDEVWQVLGK